MKPTLEEMVAAFIGRQFIRVLSWEASWIGHVVIVHNGHGKNTLRITVTMEEE